MPIRSLPGDPSLEHLRKDAKRLHKAAQAGDAAALAQVAEFHPRAADAVRRFLLSDAQLVTARTYGFSTWAALKHHLAAIEPFVWNEPPAPGGDAPVADLFVSLACLTYGKAWHRSNPSRAARLLEDHPDLTRASVYAAAAAGDVAAVRAMIEREPPLVHARGGLLRWEPLLYACYSRVEPTDATHSTLEVARLLLEGGGDPNAGFLFDGVYVFTALTGAFGRGEDNMNELPHPQWKPLARLLLDAGADPNDSQTLYNRHFEENDDHLTLLYAYGLGADTRGPWLARMNDPGGGPRRWLVQELCWAATHGFPNRVRLLVEHGVDVNTRSPRSGRTPYEEALREGHHEIANYLLAHGARKTELDSVETFALACIAGRRDEVHARLRDDPALFEELGDYGRADLLHRAVAARQHDGVRLIVELGADVNAMIAGTGLDRAPLHQAAGTSVEMVRLLIELGADPNQRDPTFHAKPLGWALYAEQDDIVEFLLQFGSIFDAVQAGAVERVDAALRRDPSLAAAVDEDGDPLVAYVFPDMRRRDEMVQMLAARGVDLNARFHTRRTLLDRALARATIDFADALRTLGARTSAELER